MLHIHPDFVHSLDAAGPGKGERYMEAVTDRLAAFFVVLAAADPGDMYEDE